MKTLITGTSHGIGLAIAEKFLQMGHIVVGMDIDPASIDHPQYEHLTCDVTSEALPEIPDVEILVNNAGVQQMNDNDIRVNLMGAIHITEKYAFQEKIHAVVNIASSSGSTGAEFPEYAASKGGLIAYTKNVAQRIAKFGATCNAVSPGGVITELNDHIMKDEKLWRAVLDETLLDRWADVEEIAEWVYFVAVVNKSMTAQDLLIDNGEAAKFNFIW